MFRTRDFLLRYKRERRWAEPEPMNPYMGCIQQAERAEAELRARSGWWEARGCGSIPRPEHRFTNEETFDYARTISRPMAERGVAAQDERERRVRQLPLALVG